MLVPTPKPGDYRGYHLLQNEREVSSGGPWCAPRGREQPVERLECGGDRAALAVAAELPRQYHGACESHVYDSALLKNTYIKYVSQLRFLNLESIVFGILHFVVDILRTANFELRTHTKNTAAAHALYKTLCSQN